VEPPVEEVKLDSASPGDKNCRIKVFLECFDWTLSCTFVLSWNIDKGQLELFHFVFSISNLYFSVFKHLYDPTLEIVAQSNCKLPLDYLNIRNVPEQQYPCSRRVSVRFEPKLETHQASHRVASFRATISFG
jgi:hypothetical protein